MATKKNSKWKALKEWAEAILVALVLVWGVKTFVGELFIVPTPSMENSLLVGDYVVASKFHFGARLPITPLTMPFISKNEGGYKSNYYSPIIQLPYFRLPGISTIKHNDIIAFNFPKDSHKPIDQRTYFVKRCIALPGDTLAILNGEVYLNFVKQQPLPNQKFNYTLTFKKPVNLVELGIDPYYSEPVQQIQLDLTQQQAQQLADSITVLKSIKRQLNPMLNFSDAVFPYQPSLAWNEDNFGPLYIPKKGESIKLTPKNLAIYGNLINTFEGQNLEIEGKHKAYINGELVTHYTFNTNYYFVLGDNRNQSMDSRFWGFVPETHIFAKPLFVLWSTNKNSELWFNTIRWNRIGKWLN